MRVQVVLDAPGKSKATKIETFENQSEAGIYVLNWVTHHTDADPADILHRLHAVGAVHLRDGGLIQWLDGRPGQCRMFQVNTSAVK